ncbi:SAM-dependent methyltransferase [Paenibacillus sp. 598K]|uniref:class I SAM-dependent methyltransferase n=1 Tax=Paenibacillus sp. 598K TaxID=1117987 RepID=UPI000FFA782B|nr:class I SAM-dependent methyltransferase [Paenibacillus sp. 598K]GBF76920.1 SAM-dependent methyltransferase [Paenibacillus sp. 598K]
MKTNNWETFFDAHAPHYMSNGYTKNTVAEVDFLLTELTLLPGSEILDIGCGTGRHAIELAKRGYRVTGVDISAGMLAEAARQADEAQVHVDWVHSDATVYVPTKRFDAVLCLCEGAFGLVGRDEEPITHDMAILGVISDALKPCGRLILTTLNAYARVRSLTQEDVAAGRFDPVTMIEHAMTEWELPEGKQQVEVKERRYFPFELKTMMAQVGLLVTDVWGGTAGNWQRASINLDEIEIMLIAVKD